MNENIKNEKEENNRKILMLILGILTILVALIGATFAYFVVEVRNTNGNESVILQADTVQGIVYTASEPIVMLNTLPGSTGKSTFTVHNPNASATATYSMSLITDVNDFVSSDGSGQLLITLSGERLNENKILDMTNGNDKSDRLIVQNLILKPQATDTYNIKVDFTDIGVAQDANQNKSFAGHIEVNQSVFVADNQG